MAFYLLNRQSWSEIWSMKKPNIDDIIKKAKRDNYHILYFRIKWNSLGSFLF